MVKRFFQNLLSLILLLFDVSFLNTLIFLETIFLIMFFENIFIEFQYCITFLNFKFGSLIFKIKQFFHVVYMVTFIMKI